MPELYELPLKRLRLDERLQARVRICGETVKDYVEVVKALQARLHAGETISDKELFPPILVHRCPDAAGEGMFDWVVSGFHRTRAHILANARTIRAYLHQGGTFRDAVLAAVGQNARHGLPRSSEDKRRAVRMIATDPEWGGEWKPRNQMWTGWTNREIARHCGVSEFLVRCVREELKPRRKPRAKAAGEPDCDKIAPSESAPQEGSQSDPDSVVTAEQIRLVLSTPWPVLRCQKEDEPAVIAQVERTIKKLGRQLGELGFSIDDGVPKFCPRQLPEGRRR